MAKRSSKRVRPVLRPPSLRRRLLRLALRLFVAGLLLGIYAAFYIVLAPW